MSEPRTNQTAFVIVAVIVAALAVVAILAVLAYGLLGVRGVQHSSGGTNFVPIVSGKPVFPSPTPS
jgi:hypothetical protein